MGRFINSDSSCEFNVFINKPLVTIITIVFNGEKFIHDTINSVINQTYKNIEYIIIDGGSTDKTIEIIRSYENNGIKWISEPDKGISDAFNKGINIAKGRVISLINADDWYNNNAVEEIMGRYIDDNTILCGNVKLYKNGIKNRTKRSTLKGIEREMTIWHPGMFVPKQVYDRIGLYDNSFKILMDYDFVIRCYLKKVEFLIVDEDISNMRSGGVSNKLIAKSMKESLVIKNIYFTKKIRHYLEYFYYSFYYMLVIYIKKMIY